MAISRDTVFLIVLLNLVLTSLVVAGAFVLFEPKAEQAAPGDAARIEEAVRVQEQRLSQLKKEIEAHNLGFDERLALIESQPRPAPEADTPEEALPAESGQAAPEKKEPTPQEQWMKGLGQMMQQQARRQRDRFFEEVMNPSAQNIERNERRIRGMAEQASRGIGLGPADQAAVEQILIDVDRQRRERLREVFEVKESADNVRYSDVKEILDQSFEEEDQRITQTLSPEQAQAYQENAAPFRGFIQMAAQTAFPEGESQD